MAADPNVPGSWITTPSERTSVNSGVNASSLDNSTGYRAMLQNVQNMISSNNAASAAAAQKQYEFNAAEAQKSRDWQEYMSNTSHQREVDDLIAAGLNPILSANNGASSGSNTMASGSVANTDESGTNVLGNYMAALLNSATSIMNTNTSANATMRNADISADVSREIANISAAANMYSSDNAREASKYAANSSYAANKYSVDENLDYQYSHPSTKYQTLGNVVEAITNTANSGSILADWLSSTGRSAMWSEIKSAYKGVFQDLLNGFDSNRKRNAKDNGN